MVIPATTWRYFVEGSHPCYRKEKIDGAKKQGYEMLLNDLISSPLYCPFPLRPRDHRRVNVMEVTSAARVPWSSIFAGRHKGPETDYRVMILAPAHCVGDTWYVCGGVNPVGTSWSHPVSFLQGGLLRPLGTLMTRGGKEGRACRGIRAIFKRRRSSKRRTKRRPSVWTAVTNHLLQPGVVAIPPTPREREDGQGAEVWIRANRCVCSKISISINLTIIDASDNDTGDNAGLVQHNALLIKNFVT